MLPGSNGAKAREDVRRSQERQMIQFQGDGPTGPETFDIDFDRWFSMIELAGLYGWIPKATLPPVDHDTEVLGTWHGEHVAPCGQRVRTDDANQLAEAIERALQRIPWFPPLHVVEDEYTLEQSWWGEHPLLEEFIDFVRGVEGFVIADVGPQCSCQCCGGRRERRDNERL